MPRQIGSGKPPLPPSRRNAPRRQVIAATSWRSTPTVYPLLPGLLVIPRVRERQAGFLARLSRLESRRRQGWRTHIRLRQSVIDRPTPDHGTMQFSRDTSYPVILAMLKAEIDQLLEFGAKSAEPRAVRGPSTWPTTPSSKRSERCITQIVFSTNSTCGSYWGNS
jgi:hypothetical protein